MVEVVVRPGVQLDRAYLVSTWLRSDLRTPRARECIRVYSREQSRVVNGLLERETVTARVAVLPDDEDAIVGFAVLEPAHDGLPACIHYVYVRDGLRRQGVARKLLAELGLVAGQAVEYSSRIAGEGWPLPPTWNFNPYRQTYS